MTRDQLLAALVAVYGTTRAAEELQAVEAALTHVFGERTHERN